MAAATWRPVVGADGAVECVLYFWPYNIGDTAIVDCHHQHYEAGDLYGDVFQVDEVGFWAESTVVSARRTSDQLWVRRADGLQLLRILRRTSPSPNLHLLHAGTAETTAIYRYRYAPGDVVRVTAPALAATGLDCWLTTHSALFVKAVTFGVRDGVVYVRMLLRDINGNGWDCFGQDDVERVQVRVMDADPFHVARRDVSPADSSQEDPEGVFYRLLANTKQPDKPPEG